MPETEIVSDLCSILCVFHTLTSISSKILGVRRGSYRTCALPYVCPTFQLNVIWKVRTGAGWHKRWLPSWLNHWKALRLWISQFISAGLSVLVFQMKILDVKSTSLFQPCWMLLWVTGWSVDPQINAPFLLLTLPDAVLLFWKDFPSNPIKQNLNLRSLLRAYLLFCYLLFVVF